MEKSPLWDSFCPIYSTTKPANSKIAISSLPNNRKVSTLTSIQTQRQLSKSSSQSPSNCSLSYFLENSTSPSEPSLCLSPLPFSTPNLNSNKEEGNPVFNLRKTSLPSLISEIGSGSSYYSMLPSKSTYTSQNLGNPQHMPLDANYSPSTYFSYSMFYNKAENFKPGLDFNSCQNNLDDSLNVSSTLPPNLPNLSHGSYDNNIKNNFHFTSSKELETISELGFFDKIKNWYYSMRTPSIKKFTNKDNLDRNLNTPLMNENYSDDRSINLHVPPTNCEGKIGETGSLWQTALAIFKAFIGTGLLFLPRAAYNGGALLFSVSMTCVFICTLYSTSLLIKCSSHTGFLTYGGIAKQSFGRYGHLTVDISIILTQLSFCSIYALFVATNLHNIFLTFNNCQNNWLISLPSLLIVQSFLHIPLSFIRKITQFTPYLLIANFCSALSIFGILGIVAYTLIKNPHTTHVQLINPTSWPIMLGTTIYSWEGVSMVLPIRASMQKDKQKHFYTIFSLCMIFYLLGILVFSLLSYATFGDQIGSIVTSNLPPNAFSIILQIAYVTSILVTYPFMMHPVSQTIEERLFKLSPKSLSRKLKKNILRAFLVIISIMLAYVGLQQLDNFVALIGSFCCIPLAFIYPALFHLRLFPKHHILSTVLRVFMCVGGAFFIIFTSYQSISTWHAKPFQPSCFIAA